MSGGSMDYLYCKVEEASFVKNTAHRVAFQRHLMKVAKALHDIEWVDSGDSAAGSENDAIEEVLNDEDWSSDDEEYRYWFIERRFRLPNGSLDSEFFCVDDMTWTRDIYKATHYETEVLAVDAAKRCFPDRSDFAYNYDRNPYISPTDFDTLLE